VTGRGDPGRHPAQPPETRRDTRATLARTHSRQEWIDCRRSIGRGSYQRLVQVHLRSIASGHAHITCTPRCSSRRCGTTPSGRRQSPPEVRRCTPSEAPAAPAPPLPSLAAPPSAPLRPLRPPPSAPLRPLRPPPAAVLRPLRPLPPPVEAREPLWAPLLEPGTEFAGQPVSARVPSARPRRGGGDPTACILSLRLGAQLASAPGGQIHRTPVMDTIAPSNKVTGGCCACDLRRGREGSEVRKRWGEVGVS
jgi:hypothetical protein